MKTIDLTQADRVCLTGILNDTREMQAIVDDLQPNSKFDWITERKIEEFINGIGTRINHIGWAGLAQHDPSMSKTLQRALIRLEENGLIERDNRYGNKTRATHVKLTADGRQLAELFAGEAVSNDTAGDPHSDSKEGGQNCPPTEGNSDGT